VTQFNFAGHDVDTGEQFTLPWVPLESFAIAGVEYIVIEGAHVDGCKIAGLFAADGDQTDAVYDDETSVGNVSWDSLSRDQQDIAAENSRRLLCREESISVSPSQPLCWLCQ